MRSALKSANICNKQNNCVGVGIITVTFIFIVQTFHTKDNDCEDLIKYIVGMTFRWTIYINSQSEFIHL